MKQRLIKSLMLIAVLLTSNAIWAYSFEVDGIYYKRSGNDVSVTYLDTEYNSYSGDVVIPATVTYEETTYNVTSIGLSAFKNCIGLTSITIPNSVISIDSSAFNGCSGLLSVTIPNSVTSIKSYAFSNCTGLTSITIPNSVTSIDKLTFKGSYNLTSIIVESNNAIYDSRDNCNAIIETETNTLIFGCKSTIFPNTVTSIGEYAFSGCKGLTSIEIPNTITSIGSYAFYGCSDLTSVTIPNSVTILNKYTFWSCSNLTSITIPNSITEIGTEAFNGCKKLTSIHIPNSVTNIGNFCFTMCENLTSITIPSSCKEIGTSIFSDCNKLTEIIVDENNKVYDSRNNCNAIIETSSNTLIAACNNSTIPNGVTTIGQQAFSGCLNLTTINLPNSIISIGQHAFSGCENLEDISFPNSLTTIENFAFGYCMKLTSIYIPQSVTHIGTNPFICCPDLETIIVDSENQIYDSRQNSNAIIETATNSLITGCKETVIPNTITSIDKLAFRSCFNLTNIEIPNSVTSIGNSAFLWCSGLTNIKSLNPTPPTCGTGVFDSVDIKNLTLTVPAESVELYASADTWKGFGTIVTAEPKASDLCYNIISDTEVEVIAGETKYTGDIVIPNETTIDGKPYTVTTIGNSAFYNCTGLTSVIIPNSVTSIGNYAFESCWGLTSVTIPNSVTSIQRCVFSGCVKLTSIIVESGNTVYDSRDNCNAIIETATNTLISGCKTTVITSSVTSIGDYAFYNCDGLTSVTIPNSVTSIGTQAFSNCYDLTSVTIPNSVTNIGNYAFYNCTGLTSVTIPNSVTSISSSVFQKCQGLTSIVVERGNTVYDSRDNCNAIIETATNTLITGCHTTVIPNSVTSIGVGAFTYCTGLTSVTIPNSVTSIGFQAFYNCTGLTSVTIPNSVTSIDYEVFYNCTGLTSVTIPNSVTSIGGNPFLNCSSLTSIVVDSENTVYDSRNNCNAIIETATNTLISGCKTTVIPSSVTSIGNWAFMYCTGLTSVTIPNSVTNIGILAFFNCDGLTKIICESATPATAENSTFEDVPTTATLYVPAGSKDVYASATGWNHFTNIEEVTVSDVYSFAAEKATTFKGKPIMLPVNLVNSGNVSAFQFDIYLPEGITIPFDEEEEEYLMTLNPERATDTHSVLTNKQANGAIRYICNSSKSEAFAGESGTELFSIPLNISSEIEGEFNIEFKNIKLSSSDAEVRNCEDISVAITVKPYSLGDSNGDDNINIADIVNITNYVLGKPTKTFIEIASDVNKDGDINIGDVVGTVNLVLNTSTSTKSMISSKQVYQKAVAVEASSQESVFINDFTICANESKTIEVNMTNSNTYSGLEFNLHLPEGLTVDYDEEEEEYLFGKTSRLTGSHSINYNKVADNVFRFVIYSSSSKNIKLNEGAIMTIPFTASADMLEGGYQIEIKNVIVSTSEAEDYEFGNSVANVTVCPDPMTGINDIVEDNTEVDYYNLQGVKVAKENLTQGVYIKKKGGNAVKVMLK